MADNKPYQDKDLRQYRGHPTENIVRFSHAWNRLNGNNGKLGLKYFTTIRSLNHAPYWLTHIGEEFTIVLNNRPVGKAILADARQTALDSVSPELLVMDTGTEDYRPLFEKFGVENECVLLLFRNIEHLPNEEIIYVEPNTTTNTENTT